MIPEVSSFWLPTCFLCSQNLNKFRAFTTSGKIHVCLSLVLFSQAVSPINTKFRGRFRIMNPHVCHELHHSTLFVRCPSIQAKGAVNFFFVENNLVGYLTKGLGAGEFGYSKVTIPSRTLSQNLSKRNKYMKKITQLVSCNVWTLKYPPPPPTNLCMLSQSKYVLQFFAVDIIRSVIS